MVGHAIAAFAMILTVYVGAGAGMGIAAAVGAAFFVSHAAHLICIYVFSIAKRFCFRNHFLFRMYKVKENAA